MGAGGTAVPRPTKRAAKRRAAKITPTRGSPCQLAASTAATAAARSSATSWGARPALGREAPEPRQNAAMTGQGAARVAGFAQPGQTVVDVPLKGGPGERR